MINGGEHEPTGSADAPAGGRWRTVWRGIQLLLVAALVYAVYRALAPQLEAFRWHDLIEWHPSWGRLALSFVLLVAVYLAHAFLWRRIMADLHIGRPSARDTVRVYFLSSLGRYLPGKLWQLAGLAVLAGRAGLPPGPAAAAAVLGQFAFLTTGMLFLALLLPQWGGGGTALLAGIVLLLIAVAAWALVATPLGHAGRVRILARVRGGLGARLAGAFALAERIRPRAALLWAVGYGATWVGLGLAFSLFVSAFVPAAQTAARHLAGTIAASYMSGYLVVIAPAGMGVREVAMGGLLKQVPGMPIAGAVAIPIFSRVWFTLAELVPLVLVPLLPSEAGPGATTTGAGPADRPAEAGAVDPADDAGRPGPSGARLSRVQGGEV